MKLDRTLYTKLLLSLEGTEEVDLTAYDKTALLKHKALLIEAGLAKGSILRGDDQVKAVVLSELTLDGHRELSSLRASGQLKDSSITTIGQPHFQTKPTRLNALTPQQQELLKWLVTKIKSNELSSEFLVGWFSDGPVIANHSSLAIPNNLTKGNIYTLSEIGFLRSWPAEHDSLWCSIKQAAFDAFDLTKGEQTEHSHLIGLRDFIEKYYDDEGLKDLCFSLGIVKYDNLPSNSLRGRARDLVTQFDQLGKLRDLELQLAKERPIPYSNIFGHGH